MTTIVMSVEGVLTDHPPTDTLLNYEATDLGRQTFNLLKNQARIILLSSDPYEDRVKQWLIRERIIGYAMIYTRPVDSPLPFRQWRIERMTDMIGVGHQVSYYVDTDPQTVSEAMEVGITGLLIARSGKRPGQDRGKADVTPWYSLVQKVDEQNAIRSELAQQESERE